VKRRKVEREREGEGEKEKVKEKEKERREGGWGRDKGSRKEEKKIKSFR